MLGITRARLISLFYPLHLRYLFLEDICRVHIKLVGGVLEKHESHLPVATLKILKYVLFKNTCHLAICE